MVSEIRIQNEIIEIVKPHCVTGRFLQPGNVFNFKILWA